MRRKRAVFDLLVLLAAVGIAYIGQVLGQNSFYWLIGGLVAALVVACIQWFTSASGTSAAKWQDLRSLPSDKDIVLSRKPVIKESKSSIVYDEFGGPMRKAEFHEIEWGSLIAYSLVLLVVAALGVLAVLSEIYPNMFPAN